MRLMYISELLQSGLCRPNGYLKITQHDFGADLPQGCASAPVECHVFAILIGNIENTVYVNKWIGDYLAYIVFVCYGGIHSTRSGLLCLHT